MQTTEERPQAGIPARRKVVVVRTPSDRVFRRLASSAGALTLVILVLIGLFLFFKGLPAIKDQGLAFFTTQVWNPPPRGNEFGVAAILYWTVVVALIALVIAVPVSIAAALFVTEFAPRRVHVP